jgi:small-conductance mechanosensitive channel
MGTAARTVIATIGLLLLAVHSAFALDTGIITRAEHAIENYQAEMDAARQKMRGPVVSESDLIDLRSTFERLRASGAERSAELQGPLTDIQSQLESLGPAPNDGRAEDASIAKTRDDLLATRDKLQGLKSQLDVLTINAEQSAAEVSVQQRDQFFERIFDRNRSILNPSLWVDMWNGIGALSLAMSIFMQSWWRDVSPNASPWGLAAVPIIVIAFFTGYQLANRWLGKWMNRFTRTGTQLDDMTRLWLIVRSLLGTIVALLVLIGPIHLALEVSGYMTARVLMIWMGLLLTVVYALLYYRVALGISAPGAPERRIIDVGDRAALRFTILSAIIGTVAAFNTQLIRIADGLYLGFNYTVGHSAISALVLLLLISVTILTLRNQPGFSESGGRRLYFAWAANLMPFVWLVILVGFGALLLGYLSLANYLAHQIIRTAMLVTVVFLFYHLLDAAVAASFDPHSSFGIFLRRMTGMSERSIERTGLIIRTGVDVFLIIAGVPTLLLLWTLTWVDFGGFINTLKIGVQIGDITISPAVAFAVLGTLVGGVIVTKLFNRWLNRRILPDTRINKGVQDSILKGATYTGYVLAAGFALAAAGINFSNIAIIAGALGVGIGFGLQSIVNNFVSGLIILAERPVRVGDWVSLPAGEGIVRRINVRSTEIETFDSSSIILPNSLLVSEPVRNWTHVDNRGRILVAATVDFGNDAEAVKQIFIDVAKQHPKILSYPEPNVTLARFSANGLDFELRAFVADIFDGSQVASDIRFKLLSAFRDKGVSLTPSATVTLPAKA